uniref:glutamine--tRNA ligase n=2 Tax=Euplotes harpa TaxID=151035 RepID=A0A7S3J4C7_9SPIT|mmetsp:Transcript_1392/g.1568  ORF Transcript_1392/g.1568 Transcript_1392/m.1568 type:complete len:760 (+) Transcript_1392:2-2281(+)
MESNLEQIFLDISIEEKTVKNIIKNAKVSKKLKELIDLGEIKTANKNVGNLLYLLSTKLPESIDNHAKFLVEYVRDEKINTTDRLTAAIKSLQGMDTLDVVKFEEDCGVGVVVTEAEVDEFVSKLFSENEAAIKEQAWDFKFPTFIHQTREALKWADGKVVMDTINRKTVEVLGEKPKDVKKKPKKEKPAKDEVKKEEEEDDLQAYKKKKISQLVGRDVDGCRNSEEVMKKHLEITGGKVITRFPPEPNGYLHIGHAKAMRFSFTVASDNDGHCYLRYDDTNPEKECQEYIDNIEANVRWLGYEPYQVTFSSDYFQQLYDYAVELIKKGKAYVCHQTAEEMRKGRQDMVESPYRNRSIEENLELFEQMRQGRFEEGECSLRMKIQMDHDNPNMRDHVAYRIKYTPHPHAGDKWCVYPTYDYTHCICDSIEHVTHSLCTLEFENRRESYYWLLDALDIYKPLVWEYSRLNISNTVLSKRKIDELIKRGICDSWSDPRLMTLNGLKRRGYTPEAINEFCDCIGVAKKGNEKVIDVRLLEHFIRKDLDEKAPRTYCVTDPLRVVFEDIAEDEEKTEEGDLFPGRPEKGKTTYTLTKSIFIEESDFSEEHKAKYYGLTPEQPVRLFNGPFIKFKEAVKNADGTISHIVVTIDANVNQKIKGCIHWVSEKYSMTVRVNLYDRLFNEENPKALGKNWLSCVNKNSLIVKENSKMWLHLSNIKPYDRFQFLRKGYFTVAEESTEDLKVLNCTVTLVESKDAKSLKK